MPSLLVGGDNNNLVIYTDNKDHETKIVINQITQYFKQGTSIMIFTGTGVTNAKFPAAPGANTAEALLDSLF